MTTPFLFVPVFSWPAAPGGKLHTYAAGGTTPQGTWSDAAGTVPNANPVTLDSNGTALVRLTSGLAYHFVLKDSTDTTTLWDADNYQASYLTQSDIAGLLYPRTAAEIAAGVTPSNFLYQPWDVRRYGATGVGAAHDDTASFQTAASLGVAYVESVGYTWNLSTFVPGVFTSNGVLKFNGGTGYIRYENLSNTPFDDNDNGIRGILTNGGSVLLLGDSISAGGGASIYTNDYVWLFMRSLINSRDYGFDRDSGFGYHTTINFSNVANEPGISWTGTVIGTGVVANRLQLTAGQILVVTGRQLAALDVIYDGAVSSGSLTFSLNGAAVYSTQAISGAGLNSTGPFTPISSATGGFMACSESDSITITAVGGTVVITGIVGIKVASNAPLLYVAAQSGTTFSDYTGGSAITELAFYLNYQKSTAEKLMIFVLGTNSIYNAGKVQTPSAMIASLQSIITSINAVCTNMRYAVNIPPRSNEALFPVINTSFTHGDYANALIAFANQNGYAVIRTDKSSLATGTHYQDGLHPDNIGHRIMAEQFCQTFNIPLNPYMKTTALGAGNYSQGQMAYNSTWRNFTNNTLYRVMATRVGNIVTLSGIAEPNGSGSTTVGTLPSAFRPNFPARGLTMTCQVDTGAAKVTVNSDGTVVLGAVPATFCSLDGISYTLVRP